VKKAHREEQELRGLQVDREAGRSKQGVVRQAGIHADKEADLGWVEETGKGRQ
jgi:hypothetical protein